MKQAASGAWLTACFVLVSYVACSSNLRMEVTCPSETSVDFHLIHGVMFQKIEVSNYFNVFESVKEGNKHFLNLFFNESYHESYFCLLLLPQVLLDCP
jgi:hypothetical protein